MADGTTRDALIFVAGLLVIVLLLATVLPRMPWLTDWRLARRYPWRADRRILRLHADDAVHRVALWPGRALAPGACGAPVVGVLGVLACEPALRRGSARPPGRD